MERDLSLSVDVPPTHFPTPGLPEDQEQAFVRRLIWERAPLRHGTQLITHEGVGRQAPNVRLVGRMHW